LVFLDGCVLVGSVQLNDEILSRLEAAIAGVDGPDGGDEIEVVSCAVVSIDVFSPTRDDGWSV